MSKEAMHPDTAFCIGCFSFLSIAVLAHAAVLIIRAMHGISGN